MLLLYAVCSELRARVIHRHEIFFMGLILHKLWGFQNEVFVTVTLMTAPTAGAHSRIYHHHCEWTIWYGAETDFLTTAGIADSSCNDIQQGAT